MFQKGFLEVSTRGVVQVLASRVVWEVAHGARYCWKTIFACCWRGMTCFTMQMVEICRQEAPSSSSERGSFYGFKLIPAGGGN